MLFEKKVFRVVQRWNASLGEHLGLTFAVSGVSAIFCLDTSWSWIGCLNVSQQRKSKLPGICWRTNGVNWDSCWRWRTVGSHRLMSAIEWNLCLVLVVVLLTDFSDDRTLFSFLVLQLKEQEKQRHLIEIVTWHPKLQKASPASSVKLLLEGFLGRAVRRFKVQRMQCCCRSSPMALQETQEAWIVFNIC